MAADKRKFKLLLSAGALLVFGVIAFSSLRETVLPGIESYVKRRLYYENTISKKGLSMHQGMHWKSKEP